MSAGSLSDLERFYDYLYGGRLGLVYAATKENGQVWKQYFFAWPDQRNELLHFTRASQNRLDVYVAPALFSDKTATKDYVLDTPFVWVEFDQPPGSIDDVPPPTCRVASGGDSHEHWYWKLDRALSPQQVDIINQALAYHLGGDPSGWDCSQVLRPPETSNHKRKRHTSLLEITNAEISPSLFQSIPAPPTNNELPVPDYIPPVEQVTLRYQFPDQTRKLFMSMVMEPGRSDALMQLGYDFAEIGMAQPEILALLLNADERWCKFKGRPDRMRRLMEIVSIAVAKYPPSSTPVDAPKIKLQPLGFKTLLQTEVNLEWRWDGFLQEAGYMLLTGPTGVGKTQFTLDAAGHLCLGKNFLDKPTKQSRIGFFSLEMPLPDLKHFLSQMQYSFTQNEQNVLEDRLKFFALGEPFMMMEETEQVEEIVGDLKLDGIVVDSLGSATDEEVSNEKIKRFFHWNDRLRARHKIFTWYIHHHRKANGDNRKPNKISDVYGSQYITSYATSVACLWESGIPNVISYIPLKMRLAPREPVFPIARDEKLHFFRVAPGTVVTQPVGPLTLGKTVPALQDLKGLAGQGNAIPGPLTASPGDLTASQALTTGAWSMGPKTEAEFAESKVFTVDLGGI